MENLKDKFEIVPIGQLVPSKTNPRRSFNEAYLSELAESIKQVGIINPITARKSGSHLEIIAGECRYRAAKLAGHEEVPVIIRKVTDDEVLEVQIIENLQRKDVHPLDEAHGFKGLLDSGKYDIHSIAVKVGKSEKYVYQRLKLLDLIDPIQKAFYAEDIMLAHAVLFCKLQPADQKDAFKAVTCDRFNGKKRTKDDYDTPQELKQWIESHILMELKKAQFNKDACIHCSKRTGFNKNLFPELDAKDMCTDPSCFNSKIEGYLEERKSELKEKKEKFVLIASSYYPDNKKVIGYSDYTKVEKGKKKCDSMVKGLYVEGSLDEKGKVIDICMDRACKVHYAYSASQMKTPEQKKEEKEKRERIQLRERTNGSILNSLLDIIPVPYTRKELEILAKYVFEHCAHDFKIVLFKRHGWEPVVIKSNYGGSYRDYSSALENLLPNFTDDELLRLFIEIAFLDEIKVNEYTMAKGDRLREAAKSYGINIESIEKSHEPKAKEKQMKKVG